MTSVTVEDAGLVGPDSVTWQVHSDPSMWIGGIRSLFLQALHPRVVAGVVQNSDYRTDPLGRLFRTADFIGTTTYGTRAQAEKAGERVRRIHRALPAKDSATGETFRLDEPELLLWVHCAEVVSFADVARLSGMPLTRGSLDRYFDEQRAVAALVGLDPSRVPGSVRQMRGYFAEMRPRLSAGPDARTISAFLHRPPLTGALRFGLGVYEPLMAHLAYSLLPRWAVALYGDRAYPRPAALTMLRGLRTFALMVPSRVPFFGLGPHATAAIDRLGADARPSMAKL
jgi:uncharacterized protein (DUF2236 family)